jgi:hypothetical protein
VNPGNKTTTSITMRASLTKGGSHKPITTIGKKV